MNQPYNSASCGSSGDYSFHDRNASSLPQLNNKVKANGQSIHMARAEEPESQ